MVDAKASFFICFDPEHSLYFDCNREGEQLGKKLQVINLVSAKTITCCQDFASKMLRPIGTNEPVVPSYPHD